MPKIVTAAIVIREGRVLIARRAEGQAHAGYWEFPGGKLEAGETEEACLEREMREELGARGRTLAHLADSLYAYERGEILLRGYLFDWPRGEAALRVHDAVRWVGPDALKEVRFTPADVSIAASVAQYMAEHVL